MPRFGSGLRFDGDETGMPERPRWVFPVVYLLWLLAAWTTIGAIFGALATGSVVGTLTTGAVAAAVWWLSIRLLRHRK